MKTRVKVISAEQGLSPYERETAARWAGEIFGPMELTRRYTWSKGWSYAVMVYSGEDPVSSLRILERRALIDGSPVRLGGLKAVMTPPEHRGKGYATRALREAGRVIFEEMGAEVGFLLCVPDLISFYARRGWQPLDCPVLFDQSGEKLVWPEGAMILTKPGERRSPKAVDLCGLPW